MNGCRGVWGGWKLVVVMPLLSSACATPGYMTTELPQQVVRYDATVNEFVGRRSYAPDDSVRVVLADMNPFLHSYRVRVTESIIAETAPADFFRMALGLNFPDPTAVAVKDRVIGVNFASTLLTAQVLDNVRATQPSCPGAPAADEVATVEAHDRVASQAKEPVATAFRELASYTKSAEAMIRPHLTTLQSIHSREGILRDAGNSAVAEYRILAQRVSERTADLKARLPTFNARVRAYSKVANDLSRKYPACHEFDQYVIRSDALIVDTVQFASNLSVANALVASSTASAETIERTLQEPVGFRRAHLLGPFESSRTVRVGVERRSIRGDTAFRSVAETNLRFGDGRRFGIGAGLAFAYIADFSYGPVPGPSASGEPRYVIGVVEETRNRVAPVLSMSARVFGGGTGRLSSGTAILGATVTRSGGSTQPEFFLGVGPGLFDDRATISLGAYAGTQQQLGANVKLNEDIQEGGKVPVKRVMLLRPALVVSVRAY